MRERPLIVLVDDESDFLEIAALKLQGKGFETVAATDGWDAIAKAEELQPDLVLSDVHMVPGPNGWELALELHRNPKTRDIKLAFFTSLQDPRAEMPVAMRDTMIAELGKIIFFSKIEDVELLGSRVMNFLRSSNS
jgi:CheY-like chemotaxis protein